MVLNAVGQGEVAPWLERSIVFHINFIKDCLIVFGVCHIHNHITEDFDYSISLVRSRGSVVWFSGLRIAGGYLLLVIAVTQRQATLVDWKTFHLLIEAN